MTRVLRSFSGRLQITERHDTRLLDVAIEGPFTKRGMAELTDQLLFYPLPKFSCVRISINGVSPLCPDLFIALGRIARLGDDCILTDGQVVWEFPVDFTGFAQRLRDRTRAA